MSGPLTVPFAITAIIMPERYRLLFGLLSLVCLVSSSYAVWRMERIKRMQAEERWSRATSPLAQACEQSAFVIEYCRLLRDRYQRLDHEFTELVRFPLKVSSFPLPSQTWTSVHITLYVLRDHLVWFLTLAPNVWVRMGQARDAITLFDALENSESIVMVDLISDLNYFLERLEKAWNEYRGK